MGKIETQSIPRNERALLRHVFAQMVPQRGVQQMRCRVIGANLVTPSCVYIKANRITHSDFARSDPPVMGVQSAEGLRGILDGNLQSIVAPDRARIARLTATFAVERRLVGEDDHGLAAIRGRNFLAIDHQRYHPPFTFGRGVAGELGRAFAFGDIEPQFVIGC